MAPSDNNTSSSKRAPKAFAKRHSYILDRHDIIGDFAVVKYQKRMSALPESTSKLRQLTKEELEQEMAALIAGRQEQIDRLRRGIQASTESSPAESSRSQLRQVLRETENEELVSGLEALRLCRDDLKKEHQEARRLSRELKIQHMATSEAREEARVAREEVQVARDEARVARESQEQSAREAASAKEDALEWKKHATELERQWERRLEKLTDIDKKAEEDVAAWKEREKDLLSVVEEHKKGEEAWRLEAEEAVRKRAKFHDQLDQLMRGLSIEADDVPQS